MEVTNQSLDWDSEDMVLWRQFLESRAGRRLIPRVADAVPALLDGGDINKILIRTGEVRGYHQAIQALLALAVPPPAQQATQDAYPDLTDDSKWNDGQKLTTGPDTTP